MTRTTITRFSFGSLFPLVVGMVLCGVAAALAFGTDVLIMDGPDVVGVRSGAMA